MFFYKCLKKLDETTALLNVTCDAFIHALDECVKLATNGSSQSSQLLSQISSLDSNNSLIDRILFSFIELLIHR